MVYMKWFTAIAALAGSIMPANAQINIDGTDAGYKAAAKVAAANMMTYYTGNQPGQIPGLLPGPYYWWEAGAMFGQLIHYWKLTGDTQYNEIVKQALLFQIGQDKNYMPANQSKDLGNDDQAFWAFSVMDAAEMGFENPDSSYPSWVALAQAVWNTQFPRWETTTCGGGFRWQIYQFNAGYEYKNTISNAGFMMLSARLARYTGNQTYADWAEKSFNWIFNSPIMAKSYNAVWDGTAMANNCSDASQIYWTYNVGAMLLGTAYMANWTNNATWQARATNMMAATNIFFAQSVGADTTVKQPPQNGTIMSEVACEWPTPQTCNYDEPSFKAYFSHWLAITGQLVPSLASGISERLKASAAAAGKICTGAAMARTTMCGRRWYQTVWDGNYGIGEQMSAMSVFQNNLIKNIPGPLTDSDGGTSKSDPGAGYGSGQGSGLMDPYADDPITTGDRAGAGILTLLSMVLIAGGASWIVL